MQLLFLSHQIVLFRQTSAPEVFGCFNTVDHSLTEEKVYLASECKSEFSKNI